MIPCVATARVNIPFFWGNHLCTMKHFVASTNRIPGCTHVLLITTGSVASIKAPQIVHELLEYENVKIEVVSTQSSLMFFKRGDIESQGVHIWIDEDEWSDSYKIGDPILHIDKNFERDLRQPGPVDISTKGIDTNDPYIHLPRNEYFHVRTPADG
ncbi:hypothetical protein Ac2012v2_005473 [Leucoagaricus gongylophorus]